MASHPAFQRRHYTQVAALLRTMLDTRRDLFGRSDMAEIIDRFVDVFADDNPRFKPERFRKAIYRDGVA